MARRTSCAGRTRSVPGTSLGTNCPFSFLSHWICTRWAAFTWPFSSASNFSSSPAVHHRSFAVMPLKLLPACTSASSIFVFRGVLCTIQFLKFFSVCDEFLGLLFTNLSLCDLCFSPRPLWLAFDVLAKLTCVCLLALIDELAFSLCLRVSEPPW